MENDQDLTGDKELEALAAGGGGDQKMVPLAALEDERGKRQALEEKVRNLEENMALYRANVPSPDARRETEPPKEKDLFEGMDEGDVMTVGEIKKIFKKQAEDFNKEKEDFVQNVGGRISEVQMMITNPDYKEVIEKNLPNVLKAKPYLAGAIKSSSNPFVLAYELGKLDPGYKAKETGDKIDKEAQKIIDNLEKPQLGKTGGAGGLDKVDAYARLTDEQLEERINQVKNR
jgi:hypothetical protein